MGSFLQIFTLGKLEIFLNGERLPEFPTRKVEALLVYLAYKPKAHSREQLADLFWDERSHNQALSNLRTSLSRLNQQLADFLLVSRQEVSIDPEANIWLDAAEFSKLDFSFGAARQMRSHQSIAELESLLALYHGEFLGSFYLRDSLGFENWAAEQRRVLAKKHSLCLSYLVNHYLESGEYAQGIQYVQQLLQLEPTNELAYRQYMQLLAQTGQRTLALAEYQKCRQILLDELGTEPDAATTELHNNILEGHVPSSIRPSYNSIPLQTTKFLGRETELAQIRQHLENPECRLLSLIGLGGVGKTRLAYQIAEEQHYSFRHGICVVSLAEVAQTEFLLPKLAEALRFNLHAAKDPRQQILNYLSDKEMLIILDNCEHLLDAMTFFSDVLKTAEHVKILATSRERLNLQGEWLLSINGFPYPETPKISQIDDYPALALFIQTAKRIEASFEPNDLPSLVRICQFLDGLPLAIELAATWIRYLSLAEIVQELEKNNDLLSSQLRDIPRRHRSIQFVFAETWNMLTYSERTAFMKLAVFQGQIERQAVAAVAQIDMVQLVNFAEKSLIQPDGRGTYRLHELMRRFIWGKLEESGQFHATAKRHAEYFCQQLKHWYTAARKWHLSNAAIQDNYSNYSTALHFAVQAQDIELLAELMSRLTFYWESTFKTTEALYWIEKALNLLRDDSPEIARMRILNCAGIFYRLEPKLTEAKQFLEQGIAIARKLHSTQDLADALHTLGHICLVQGLYPELEQVYEEQLNLAFNLEDEYRIGRSYYDLGTLALDTDKLPLAKEHFAKALEIYQRLNIADSALLCNLGLIAYLEQDFAQAEVYFQESIVKARAYNEIYNVVANLINLGDIATEHQKLDSAISYYLEAFETALLSANTSGQLSSLESLAIVLAQQNQNAFATWLFSAVSNRRKFLSLPTASFNQSRNQAFLQNMQEILGKEQFETYSTRGLLADFQELSRIILNRNFEAIPN